MSWTIDGISFDLRKKITISNTHVGSTLSDFPVLVFFDADTDLGAVCQADGDDVRFTLADGSTLLSAERQDFAIAAGAATGRFWVRVPSVSTSAPTDIYCYYGSAGASAQSSPEDAWDAGFAGVFHFESEVLNSANGANDLTDAGNTTLAAGRVGQAGNFTGGTGSYLSSALLATATHFDFSTTDALHVSAWVYIDNIASELTIVGCYDTNSMRSWKFGTFTQSGTNFKTLLANWGSPSGTLAAQSYVGANVVDTGGWYHVQMSYAAGTVKLYVAGASRTVTNTATVPATLLAANTRLRVGAILISSNPDQLWDGMIDELRLSSGPRSDAWAAFEYANMASAGNELTFGEQESGVSFTPRLTLLGVG